jgi:hypothetical protein
MLISSRPVLLRPEALARLNYGRAGNFFFRTWLFIWADSPHPRALPTQMGVQDVDPAPPPIPLFQRGHSIIKQGTFSAIPNLSSASFITRPRCYCHSYSFLSRICLTSGRIPVRVMMTLLEGPPETGQAIGYKRWPHDALFYMAAFCILTMGYT